MKHRAHFGNLSLRFFTLLRFKLSRFRGIVQKQKGFSLIELLIVVAVILIIAAIAVPNLLRARIAADEASAVGSIRTINTAQITYQSTYPTNGYASTLAALGPKSATNCKSPSAKSACLIDYALATATDTSSSKSGYYFGIATVKKKKVSVSYTVGGAATDWNLTGVRSFCSIEDGVIRYDVPSAADSPTTTSSTCTSFSPLGG
jgi:type IV pilus assembly protein PilA